MSEELARANELAFELAAEVTGLRAKIRGLEAENVGLRHRLDTMRPMIERMGHVLGEVDDYTGLPAGLPAGVKGIDGTWQVPS